MSKDLPVPGARKDQHIEKCLQLLAEGPGNQKHPDAFPGFRLKTRSLPELALSDISLETQFAGRTLKAPVLVGAMTGGTAMSGRLNRDLARLAAQWGLAMELGSLRPGLEHPDCVASYDVKPVLGELPLLGNISIWQLRQGPELWRRLAELCATLQLDGLMVHVNPIQELAQPEGGRDFRGTADALLGFLAQAGLPVFLKGTGEGLDRSLMDMAVATGRLAGIETGGGGLCDFALVEALRATEPRDRCLAEVFAGLGCSAQATLLEALLACDGRVPVIAGGGIVRPIDAVKALAMGASMVSLASGFLNAWGMGKADALADVLLEGMRRLLLLCGVRNPRELGAGGFLEKV